MQIAIIGQDSDSRKNLGMSILSHTVGLPVTKALNPVHLINDGNPDKAFAYKHTLLYV